MRKIPKEWVGLFSAFLGAIAVVGGVLIGVAVFDRVTGRRSADVEPWKLLAEKTTCPRCPSSGLQRT